MQFAWMVKRDLETDVVAKQIRELARALFQSIDFNGIESTLREAERTGLEGRKTSQRVQAHIEDAALPMGFRSERKGIFADMDLALRPDLFHADLRVLLEVERGGANTNNHDLKDFWKCHLCPTADWLFLVLPERIHGGLPFATTTRRFSPFFDPGNEVNVHGVALFGY